MTLESVVRAAHRQVACTLGDEVMILNLENGVYYGLDEVGSRIWELLQEPRSVREIREALLAEFDVEEDRCERDIVQLIEELLDARLVEMGSEGAE